jgi:hypothetical protein
MEFDETKRAERRGGKIQRGELNIYTVTYSG